MRSSARIPLWRVWWKDKALAPKERDATRRATRVGECRNSRDGGYKGGNNHFWVCV